MACGSRLPRQDGETYQIWINGRFLPLWLVTLYFGSTLCGRRLCKEKRYHRSSDSWRSARRIARKRWRTYCCRDPPLSGRCRYCLCLWHLRLCCYMQILTCKSKLICRYLWILGCWMHTCREGAGQKSSSEVHDLMQNHWCQIPPLSEIALIL